MGTEEDGGNVKECLDCAVRVYDTELGIPVGVGFLASPLHVITCAHVVAAAMRNPRFAEAGTAPEGNVEVDFPAFASPTSRDTRRGVVVGWQRLGGSVPDDVAVLVLDRDAPAGAGVASACTTLVYDDRLLAFGVRAGLPDGAYVEARALGMIPGPHIQAISSNPDTALRQGCSGAAAWSVDRGGVVGMCAKGLLGSSALLIPIDRIAMVFTETTGRDLIRAKNETALETADMATTEGLRDASIATLRRLPRGPALDVISISGEVNRAFARGTSRVSAMQLIGDANELVLDALPSRPLNTHAYVIERDVLPSNNVPAQDFWFEVFANACMLGPRMVGALLLCAPPTALAVAKDAIVKLFLKLGR